LIANKGVILIKILFMKTSFKNLFFIVFYVWSCSKAQNDGSSKIERNVPIVVVDSFYSVFLLKIQSGFRNTRARIIKELVYEAKFIFDDRYCKSVYDFNGIKLLLRLR
jgi:hypothetical protein